MNMVKGCFLSNALKDKALQVYSNRYTCEHVPGWAFEPNEVNGYYYAPQFLTDAEWLENTYFPVNDACTTLCEWVHCRTSDATFPLGQWLTAKPDPAFIIKAIDRVN